MTVQDKILALGQAAAYADIQAAKATDPQSKAVWEHSAKTIRDLQFAIMEEQQNTVARINARRVIEDLGDVLQEMSNG
jgi:hypothetical protein